MGAANDSIAFLRESGIRIIIDHDVEANIDRAIELINRTNQWNLCGGRTTFEQLRAWHASYRRLVEYSRSSCRGEAARAGQPPAEPTPHR